MTDVFSNKPGFVSAMDTTDTVAADFWLQGWVPGGGMHAVIAGFESSFAVSAQVQHTLDRMLFLWVFGDRAGEATISGVAFGHLCQDEGEMRHGLELVKEYYDATKVSALGTRIVLVFGVETALECFVLGLNVALDDAERGLGRFVMRLLVLP